MPLLKLEKVSKDYLATESARPITVLRELSLDLAAGESVAIIGPSGSGKSTLLNIMGTLDYPTAGQVWLDGQDLSRLDDLQLAALRNWQIGFIFQAHHLLPQCSVIENVLVPTLASKKSTDRQGASTRAEKLLKRVGLGERLHHRPGQLSGGERQRVALGRALLAQPRLLLLDEPLGSLDEERKVEILPYLVRLRDEAGVPMVYVSHDAGEMRQLATQIVMLRRGRVIAFGGIEVLPAA